jgi:succinylarginine dihydrolase
VTAGEFNFDGIVGPTHNYAGLSFGNVASERSLGSVSSPRQAALQGLAKMKALHDMGLGQGVLPPQERPAVDVLRRLGFAGDDAAVLRAAARRAPRLLAACSSASSMWTANAATVSPAADTADGRVHFTPANLVSKFHRSIESSTTSRALRAIFADPERFAHHEPLPAVDHFGDEGAANHTRLCRDYGERGVELFVYGREAFGAGRAPRRYPARQTREASEAIARLHGLDDRLTVFAQQHPDVIDEGVFHNDVIAVGNGPVLFHHEHAFADTEGVHENLRRALGDEFQPVVVPASRISVADAVDTYLFNSQLVSLAGGDMALVLPEECRAHGGVWQYLTELVEDGATPIRQLVVKDVKQSMRNGGGPACLRLRVVLEDVGREAVSPGALLTDDLYLRLCTWVQRHYRERLDVAELADPNLLEECRTALDELTTIMGLGSIYPFQLAGA